MEKINITSCPVSLLNNDMCEVCVEGSFIHSFIHSCSKYFWCPHNVQGTVLGAQRTCAFNCTRVNSEVRETEKSKHKQIYIRLSDEYHE